MNDRQLLELAAKAVGARWHVGDWNGSHWTLDGDFWSPLDDDGDALRLAHKLGLLSDVEVWPRTIEETRRAIVRAAAEIGKEMV